MRLKTPAFWYPAPDQSKTGLTSILLAPFAWLYQCGHKLKWIKTGPYHSSTPVICVGNINIGGAGKTPTAMALMDMVSASDKIKNPCFLTRGYGGIVKLAAHVDLELYDHIDIGDEAIMLARKAQTIASRRRNKGAQLAEQYNVDCLIMDDGMQNNSLHKDLTLCVIDGAKAFGNGKTIPAGPLRETLSGGFAKSDAFVLIGEDLHNIKSRLPAGKPVFTGNLAVTALPDKAKSYVAFAGIGHPDKFRATLLDNGLDITSWHPFPDHYQYKRGTLQKLANIASANGSALITTEKDLARLPEEWVAEFEIKTLPVTLKWDDPKAVEKFIFSKLDAKTNGAK